MRQQSVLLLGSYGQTNLGDDILMWNYLNLLHDRGFKQIYVNANTAQNIPEIIKQKFPNLHIKITYGTSISDWINIFKKVSFVVYGGGTIYKELYSSTGRGRYSVIIRIMMFNILAKMFGAKIYNLNIGIGVLKTGLGRAITLMALKQAALTFFRDSESYLVAKDSLGLPVQKIRLSTDGLFLSDVWQKTWHESSLKLPSGKFKKVVGINLLSDIPDWVNREVYIMAARQFVAKLLQDNNLVLLLPFQHDFNPNNDYEFMKREIAAHFSDSRNLLLVDCMPIDEVVSVFKKLDIFVGMRFHSLLLATVATVPFVGIAYDTKCSRFLKENNYKYAVKLEDINESQINTSFQTLLNDLNEVPDELQKITKAQLKEGQVCLKNLKF